MRREKLDMVVTTPTTPTALLETAVIAIEEQIKAGDERVVGAAIVARVVSDREVGVRTIVVLEDGTPAETRTAFLDAAVAALVEHDKGAG